MGLSFSIQSSEIIDRLDPSFYDPDVVGTIRRLQRVATNSAAISGRLGEIASLRKGIFEILKEEYCTTGIPFVRVTDIRDLNMNFGDLVFIKPEKAKREPSTVPGRSLIISKSGTVGTVSLVPPSMDICAVSQDVISGSFHPRAALSPEYVAAFLSTRLGKCQLLRGATQQMQAHLNLTEARNVLVVAPEPAVHDEVTSHISNAYRERDEARDYLKQSQAELTKAIGIRVPRRFRMCYAVHSDLLDPESLAPAYYRVEALSLERTLRRTFPPARTIGEIFSIKRGGNPGMSAYGESGVPFIRTSDFPDNDIDLSPDHFISLDQARALDQDVRAGDLLFAQDGRVGDCAIVTPADFPLAYVGHVSRLRLRPEVEEYLDPGYVFAYLASNFARIQIARFTVVQSTIPTIGERLLQLVIPELPMHDQQVVGRLVTKAFKLRSEAKTHVALAKSLIVKSFAS